MTIMWMYTEINSIGQPKLNDDTYKWINEELMGQPVEMRQIIDQTSSNLEDALFAALDKLVELHCPEYEEESTEPDEPDPCDDPENTDCCCKGECGNRGVLLKLKAIPKRVRLDWA